MRIRIPIHLVFLEKADKDSSAENATNEKNITIQEVMTLTGKSRTTAWRYMKKLTDTKLVEASGNTNDAVYTVAGDKN